VHLAIPKFDQKKRAPTVYNDRLSVLDFRPKKQQKLVKANLASETKLIYRQMPSPLSTSETADSSRSTSPIEALTPKIEWHDTVFTSKDIQNSAQILLDAAAAVTSDTEDDVFEILGAELENDRITDIAESVKKVANVGDEDHSSPSLIDEDSPEAEDESEEESEEKFNELPLPLTVIDDDDTDDDWRPSNKPRPVGFLLH
jgi:hypothetical protein